jgi:cytoskeletal protein CcmA (bactofilin family)
MATPQTRTPSAASRHEASPSHAVIAATTRIRGRVTGDGDVTVHGHIEGEVRIHGELTIGETGRVVSDVEADSLRISGSVQGDVTATGDVAILAGAKVSGNVRGASVTLDEGAELDGRLDADFTLPRELLAGAQDDDGPTQHR